MSDLEKAVLLAYDRSQPATEETRAQALAYAEEQAFGPDGINICLRFLFQSKNTNIVFWSLQQLTEIVSNRYQTVPEPQKELIRTSFFTWLRDVCPVNVPAPFVRNKFAQCFALTVKNDYPECWPRAFQDLMAVLNGAGPPVIDMFLRILDAVDEEIISDSATGRREARDVKRSRDVKDAMRVDCVGTLVEAWYHLLSASMLAAPDIAVGVLKVIAKYVGWIDIGHVVNERFLGLLFQALGPGAAPGAPAGPVPTEKARRPEAAAPRHPPPPPAPSRRFLGLIFALPAP
ncbi:putative tRNA exportin [Paratrimastix pyriformis]|uniref:Exportin-T n=1 Tax=Paratrimastix pyriformis TaxID=342808 RepID=A0ABQ8UU86_9EUKA|nr:putative tRNA exportin [Paratrimastix pyriformis]